MIKTPLKKIGALKVFQCILALLCISGPITETQALFGWFGKKKKPAEKTKNRNKKEEYNQKKTKKKFIKKTKNRLSDKKTKAKLKKGIASKKIEKQYSSMDTELNSAENIKGFAEKTGLKLDRNQTIPSYEACKSDLATQMFELFPTWFKVHTYYACPVTKGSRITVPLIIGPEINTIAQPLILALQDLLNKNEDTSQAKTKDVLVSESQRVAELRRDKLSGFLKKHLSDSKQSQEGYQKSISDFIELHKAYHGESSTLEFLPSQYSQLLDVCNNIKGIKKKSNTFVYSQLNKIETILGLGQTKRGTVHVQKVMYARQDPDGQSTNA